MRYENEIKHMLGIAGQADVDDLSAARISVMDTIVTHAVDHGNVVDKVIGAAASLLDCDTHDITHGKVLTVENVLQSIDEAFAARVTSEDSARDFLARKAAEHGFQYGQQAEHLLEEARQLLDSIVNITMVVSMVAAINETNVQTTPEWEMMHDSFSPVQYDEGIQRKMAPFIEFIAPTLEMLMEEHPDEPLYIVDTGCGSGVSAIPLLDALREQYPDADIRLIGLDKYTGRENNAVEDHEHAIFVNDVPEDGMPYLDFVKEQCATTATGLGSAPIVIFSRHSIHHSNMTLAHYLEKSEGTDAVLIFEEGTSDKQRLSMIERMAGMGYDAASNAMFNYGKDGTPMQGGWHFLSAPEQFQVLYPNTDRIAHLGLEVGSTAGGHVYLRKVAEKHQARTAPASAIHRRATTLEERPEERGLDEHQKT